MDSKNSASSRAIPFEKMKTQLTGRPVRFGQANPGMQDKGEDFTAPVYVECHDGIGWNETGLSPALAWEAGKQGALEISEAFYKAGYAKQVYNRLTEPFQMMKTVFSGTELENFFWLRDHGAADPTLAELARVMREARAMSFPMMLKPGEWSLPYVEQTRVDGKMLYWIEEEDENGETYPQFLDLEDAKKVSAARCAAVSFRNVDYGVEKCRDVFGRLVGEDRKHASAFEHQATPMQANNYWTNEPVEMNVPSAPLTWEDGVSHMDRDGNLWSGNLRGFVQLRKLIPGENHTG